MLCGLHRARSFLWAGRARHGSLMCGPPPILLGSPAWPRLGLPRLMHVRAPIATVVQAGRKQVQKEEEEEGRGGSSERGVEMAGGMEVHKNKYIEEWGAARENLEKTFRFTKKNITLAVIFGIAVPYITYKGITSEFHKQDMAAGHPPRKFLGSP